MALHCVAWQGKAKQGNHVRTLRFCLALRSEEARGAVLQGNPMLPTIHQAIAICTQNAKNFRERGEMMGERTDSQAAEYPVLVYHCDGSREEDGQPAVVIRTGYVLPELGMDAEESIMAAAGVIAEARSVHEGVAAIVEALGIECSLECGRLPTLEGAPVSVRVVVIGPPESLSSEVGFSRDATMQYVQCAGDAYVLQHTIQERLAAHMGEDDEPDGCPSQDEGTSL